MRDMRYAICDMRERTRLQCGATLAEMLVVIGIAGVLLAIGLPLTWDFYLRSELRSERSNMVEYLRTARTRAMSNHDETAQGVYVATSSIVIFEGPSYAARNAVRDQVFPRSLGIFATGTAEFDFAQLSGRSASSSLTFFTSNGSTTVTVNAEGLIQ